MVRLQQYGRMGLWLLMGLLIVLPARAHDPFDGNVALLVRQKTIEAKVTLGYDATRQVLERAALPATEVARVTRPPSARSLVALPLAVASRLLTVRDGGALVPATAVMVAPGDIDISFVITFPRPEGAAVHVRAAYYATVDDMRPGTLVAIDERGKVILNTLLSRDHVEAAVHLAMAGAVAAKPVTMEEAGFTGFFLLGVEHILTGYDHLLFLFALFIAARRLGPLLGIISAFTLAHSITLALTALGVTSAPSAVIEPLIAASIVFVCIDNIVRRDAIGDRYWMAGLFGLIHGFGFAAALRETMAFHPQGILPIPLLAFNLGVEAGQLAVAALVIPLLSVLRARRCFSRWGIAIGSSILGMLSLYWCVARLTDA
jgi:hydrogenase/urease accessory protein HupE